MMSEYEMHQLTDGERQHVLSPDCWCEPVRMVVDDDSEDGDGDG